MTRFGQTTFTAAAAGLFVLGALAGIARAASPSAREIDPAKDDRSIRPFQFHAPDAALADLRRRVAATKWPSQELVTDASRGEGGDWGNAVTGQIVLQAPPEPLGIHTNMPATVPAAVEKALWSGGAAPPGLSADERHAYDQLDFFYKNGLAYAQEMSHRPQTLYAIDDSPIGLAAWMLDHDARSYELIARVFNGQKEGLTRDDILDNVTLYWLTNTGVSSARLYWESKLAFFAPKGIAIPVAVSAFPDELYQAPRSWTERAYPKLVYYNKLDRGAHFAALEQPQLFATEMRAAFNRYGSRMHTTERLVAERAVHRGVV